MTKQPKVSRSLENMKSIFRLLCEGVMKLPTSSGRSTSYAQSYAQSGIDALYDPDYLGEREDVPQLPPPPNHKPLDAMQQWDYIVLQALYIQCNLAHCKHSSVPDLKKMCIAISDADDVRYSSNITLSK